jgi:hypothetical protein
MTLATPAFGASTVNQPTVDPEVRAHVAAGRARVLVQLRVPAVHDAIASKEAIDRAQSRVLSLTPAMLVRRYETVPLLALEIDAAGLRVLETLGDVVSRVDLDRPARTQ